jgi:flavin-dependent dehydrogenase
MEHPSRDRAVILGAGIAGLLAARAVAETYGEVVIVDRDPLGPDASPRRGVPQGRHLHGLLARGHDQLEAFFPGLVGELVGAGAPKGDMLANGRLLFGGHRFRQGPSGLPALCVSRPVLEAAVRRRVAGLPNVRFLPNHDAVGLLGSSEHVSGVRLIGRADGSAVVELQADLVVDACGRGSRMPAWLESLGMTRPLQEQVRIGVGYSTRTYRLPSGTMGDDLVAICAPTPARPRGGGLSLLEGGRCMVTLMGILGDFPPVDPDGFLGFAGDLALPDIRDAIGEGEALGEPVGHRHPTSTWNRYDRLHRLPLGLVVVGDAVCALNPIYGQGMTVAALEAEALRRQLADRGGFDPRPFQREVGRIVGGAWALATGADLAFPGVEGKRTVMSELIGGYIGRLQAGAARDPRLGAAFLRVSSLVDPPAAVFRPSTALRVLIA